MKRLLLLRHAKAVAGYPDEERALAPQGLTDADSLGKALAAENRGPDIILCSRALRTRQTATAIAGEERIQLVPELYQAGSDEIISIIRHLALGAETLMVVAHNPGIGVLARILARKQAARCDAFPPCTLAEYSVNVEDWADFSYTDCKLERVRFA